METPQAGNGDATVAPLQTITRENSVSMGPAHRTTTEMWSRGQLAEDWLVMGRSASLCFWNVLGVQINGHVRVFIGMKAEHEALLPEE